MALEQCFTTGENTPAAGGIGEDAARRITDAVLCITAPARACIVPHTDTIDAERIHRAKAHLREMGWRVKTTDNLEFIEQGFAGDDATRARALMQAMCEADNDVVMALRGGYGTARILEYLDWQALGQAKAVFVGLSDLTAFNLALLAKTGRASWQGPVAGAFSKESLVRDAAFSEAMRGPGFALEVSASGHRAEVEGLLWGGNLTVLTSLLGTAYMPEITDGILFLEDVAEPAWRIERMLVQLIDSGVLSSQRMIVVGDMQGHERGLGVGRAALTLDDVWQYVHAKTGLPVVRGLPFGHITDTVTMPVGVHARACFDGTMLTIESDAPPTPAEAPGLLSARALLWWV